MIFCLSPMVGWFKLNFNIVITIKSFCNVQSLKVHITNVSCAFMFVFIQCKRET